MKKLLVTRRMTPAAEAAISARFDATFRDSVDPLDLDQVRAALANYDAIIPTLGDAFGADAFAGPGRCGMLANFGAGFNHINLAAARQAGVQVSNTPDVVTDATADIAVTLLLMIARRASEGERLLRAGNWPGWRPTQLLGRHVSGRTVGIVGMGRIGRAIARRCHFGFGMRVIFFNRSKLSSLDVPARQAETLPELLRMADFVVLAVPGGAQTRHLIGADELAEMGPKGYLINVARGDVVDETALIEALTHNRIAGAGLDVYEHEPAVPAALRALENTTLLPHLGTATEDTRTSMALRALDNLLDWQDGARPRDLVT